MTRGLVLVTGGTGFLAAHCLSLLLKEGFRVRTTVRSMDRAPGVRSTVSPLQPDAVDVVRADLSADEGWDAAVAGCDYVLHVASPLPMTKPRDPDEIVRPARDGTLRVLAASERAGVGRVVMTSSFAAIAYGQAPRSRPFTEEDWTDLSGEVDPYPRSKTVAERAAWEFADRHPRLELAVVNPVVILGPPLGSDRGTSVTLVDRLLEGFPGLPKVSFGVVDVRDVASLHLLAMTHPDAAGERFLAVSGHFLTLQEVAQILRSELGDRARKVPTRILPNWVIRLAGRFDPAVAQVVGEVGRYRDATSAKAERVLGWRPRPASEAIVATAETYLAR